MVVSTRKETRDDDAAGVPARSRRGGWGIWVGAGVVAVMALAMLGFFVTGGVEEPPVALDPPDGVMLDTQEELGN